MCTDKSIAKKLFLLVCIVCFTTPVLGLEKKQEFYSIRPSAADVSARTMPHQPDDWEKNKLAFIRFLSSLYFYPQNYHFYFLARDLETAQDKALFLFPESFQNRMHTLNVSRDSKLDPHLWDYLEEKGLNNNDPHRKHLLLDTGMLGTLHDRIKQTAPAELKAKIQSYFLLSVHPDCPSSRAYLSTMDPRALSGAPREWEPTILLLENIPHYTYTAVSYEIDPATGKWEAVTGPTYKTPGMSMGGFDFGYGGASLEEKESREPRKALEYMADVRAYVEKESTRQHFEKLSKVWQKLGVAYRESVLKQDPSILERAIDVFRKKGTGDSTLDAAIIKDLRQIIARHAPYGKIKTKSKSPNKTKKNHTCKKKLNQ